MHWLRLALLAPFLGALLLASGLSLAWSAKGSEDGWGRDGLLVPPSRDFRVLMAELRKQGSNSASGLLPRATAALGRAPLEEEPFVLAALARYNKGDLDEAGELIAIARKRHPRSREARLLSFDVNLARGDIAGAVEDLEVLLRLAPRQRVLAQEALVLLAAHPETGKATVEALQDGRTKAMVLVELARSGTEPDRLIDTIQAARADGTLETDPGSVGGITNAVVQAGQVEAAYGVWAALVDKQPRRPELLRDGGFTKQLPPPFGWELRSGRDGYAALQSSGLSGEAYGRRRADLARQLLVLPSGKYRLEVDAGEENPLVEILVRCLTGSQVARMSLERQGINSSRLAVPEGCAAQWLEVAARPSDPPGASSFSIKSIAITEEGQ